MLPATGQVSKETVGEERGEQHGGGVECERSDF